MIDHDLAGELAGQGYSNGEIFAKMELTPMKVTELQRSEPDLFFSIIIGRAAYIQELLEKVTRLANGWDMELDGPEPNLRALTTLLERADHQQSSLANTYDLLLMAGFAQSQQNTKHDPAQVTKLLRVK